MQEVIDHQYKINAKLMVILCGSSMSFMEHQVLSVKSPLYGRRDAQFKIQPFTIFETRDMLPNIKYKDLMAYFGITGGIPQYLAFIDQQLSVAENINQLFLKPSAPLLEEPANLLMQELRHPATYNAILNAIAHGATKHNDIANQSDVGSGVTAQLNNLVDLGIVAKQISIFDKPTGRKTTYKIKDEMFRFWFKFIDGNTEAIERKRTRSLLQYIINKLPEYLGFTFEKVCIEWLWQWEESSIDFVQIGHWLGNDPKEKKQVEVDIVAVDKNKNALIAECKWRSIQQMDHNFICDLIKKAMLIPNLIEKNFIFLQKRYQSHLKILHRKITSQ